MSEELHAMGWLREPPDFRDYDPSYDEVAPRLKALGQRSVKDNLAKVGVFKEPAAGLAAKIDLRAWCSPIEDQRRLGSCTAQAGIGIVEYYERRAFGTHIDGARLFVYKTTRNLLGWVGDTGAYVRTTMGALALFGAPPERYWPYTDAKPDFDEEPTAFCYAFGQNYQALSYYRLDPTGTTRPALLTRVKTWLAAGLVSMFGFTVYSSYTQASANGGKIPFPVKGERAVGGHAIVAVGYDDSMSIKNAAPGAKATTGALLIRNSWGVGWGDKGYGWLPYAYVEEGLAVDWWSLVRSEWVDTKKFGF